MSQPREIAPGATYLITRRVVRRHHLFRPDAAINQLLVYALGVSARRYGVKVHAVCAMSTHLHLIVTDVQGVLPRFLQFFHRLVALGTKVVRKWEGPVWDHRATSLVRLLTHAAVVEKIAYVLANPVAAGLVRHAKQWPGVKVHVGELGTGTLHASRPSAFFDPKNPQWSEEMTISLTLPPSVQQDGAGAFRREVAAELERREAQAHVEVQRQGLRFLGAERAGKVSPYVRATSFEALRDRNPTFAVGREQRDMWRTAVAAVRAFRAAYRVALGQWCAGVRSALFPAGTWWMYTFHGVNVSDVVPAV
ncbi:transposase [Sorangium sp. So ce1335]|uniref:transposase n=1 Tax=Sorangium sp. So ce1335 TaxID=3133335 RepID=UPI003F6144FE